MIKLTDKQVQYIISAIGNTENGMEKYIAITVLQDLRQKSKEVVIRGQKDQAHPFA